jgi:hypothetical protein
VTDTHFPVVPPTFPDAPPVPPVGVSAVPLVVPIPLPLAELPSVDLSFFIRDRPTVLFVPLIPLPDAPP